MIRVLFGDEKVTVVGEQVVVLRIAIRHRYLLMIERYRAKCDGWHLNLFIVQQPCIIAFARLRIGKVL